MPIESEIPVEIDAYQKKIVLGMTLRQLVCLVAAVALAAGTFFLCVRILHLSTDNASWFVMLAACPLMAIGFVRPGNEPFEKYMARKLRRHLYQNQLCYTAAPAGFDAAGINQKGGIKYAPDHVVRAAECTWLYRTNAKRRKEKRKQTAIRIKAAQKEFRQAAARAKQAAHSAARA